MNTNLHCLCGLGFSIIYSSVIWWEDRKLNDRMSYTRAWDWPCRKHGILFMLACSHSWFKCPMTMVLVASAEPHLICSAQNLSSSFFSTGRAFLIEKRWQDREWKLCYESWPRMVHKSFRILPTSSRNSDLSHNTIGAASIKDLLTFHSVSADSGASRQTELGKLNLKIYQIISHKQNVRGSWERRCAR